MNTNVHNLSTTLINLLNRLNAKFLVINEEDQIRLEIYYAEYDYNTIHYTILIAEDAVGDAQVWCDKDAINPRRLCEISMIELMELLVKVGRY